MRTILILVFCILTTSLYSQKRIVEYYANGKIKFEGYIKGTVLDSNYIEYYENGSKSQEGTFKQCSYRTSSTVIIQKPCGIEGPDTTKPAQGIKNGTWKYYYKNGVISLLENYFCNIKVGQRISYDTLGKVDENEFYNAGKVIQKQNYYSNGKLESFLSRTYRSVQDMKDKSFTVQHEDLIFEYYENGELKSVKTTDNDDQLTGKFTEYWANGFIKLSGEYKSDKKNGYFIEYHENGNTKFEGIFKEDVPQDKQYYLNIKGKVTKIETYKKGKVINTEVKTENL